MLGFDPALLPARLRDWVVDIAERVQCPIDYVAVAAMVALSAVVGRRIGIRPKKHDDWTVVPNLWGAIIGRPGVMKTPAIQEALKPLKRMEIEAKAEYDAACKEAAANAVVAEAKKKNSAHAIKRIVKSNEQEARRLAMESLNSEDDEVPVRRRYIVNDSTVEKLGEILNQNPFGVLVYRDELIGLLKSLDKEGQEGARSFYLEAWNGTGRYTYDRIARGTIDIEAAIVSIIGGIQPGPLGQYLRAAAKEGAGDDGLIQRFQLAVWPNVSKTWKNVDRWPDSPARQRAFEVFIGLRNLEPEFVGADRDAFETDGIPFLRFNDEAQAVFDAWRETLEARLRSDELAPCLESHLAKYRSLVPSLALLIHLADGGFGPVGYGALNQALGWAVYLESHARRIYSQAINPEIDAARSLAKKILAGEVKDGFAVRDLYRNGWTGLATKDDAESAVELLMDLGWLVERLRSSNGRTAKIYLINPGIDGLRFSSTPPEATDRTDGSHPENPSGGSVSSSEGGSPEIKSPTQGEAGGPSADWEVLE